MAQVAHLEVLPAIIVVITRAGGAKAGVMELLVLPRAPLVPILPILRLLRVLKLRVY